MVIVKKISENDILILLDGNREIHVRGNYGEGCAVSMVTEDVETTEFESQGSKEQVVWEL